MKPIHTLYSNSLKPSRLVWQTAAPAETSVATPPPKVEVPAAAAKPAEAPKEQLGALDRYKDSFYDALTEKVGLKIKDTPSEDKAGKELYAQFQATLATYPHDAPDSKKDAWIKALQTSLIDCADTAEPYVGGLTMEQAATAIEAFKKLTVADFDGWFKSTDSAGYDAWKKDVADNAAKAKDADGKRQVADQGIDGSITTLNAGATGLKAKLEAIKGEIAQAGSDGDKITAAQTKFTELAAAITYINGVNITEAETNLAAIEGGDKTAATTALTEFKNAVAAYDGSEPTKQAVEAAKTKVDVAINDLKVSTDSVFKAEEAELNADDSMLGQTDGFFKTFWDGKFADKAEKITAKLLAIFTPIAVVLYKIPFIGKAFASMLVPTDVLAKEGLPDAIKMQKVEKRFVEAGIPKRYASKLADKPMKDVVKILQDKTEREKMKGFSTIPTERVDMLVSKLSEAQGKVTGGENQTMFALLSQDNPGVDFRYRKSTPAAATPPAAPPAAPIAVSDAGKPASPATVTAPGTPASPDSQKAAA